MPLRMDAPPAFDPAALFRAIRAGHTVALGLRLERFGDDWCELAMDYDRRLISDVTTGVLASGPIVSLMDMAANCAVWLRRKSFLPQVTLDLRLDYLRPARAGNTVFGRADCYRLGRRVAFVRGHAHDGDANDPIAHLAGTFIVSEAA